MATGSTGANPKKHLRLAATWMAALSLSFILLATIYTLFIARDRASFNETIYENHFLINTPHSEQLWSWEGYGVTTYGENALVVDKDVDFDSPRILIIGDSIVEAKQVSDQDKFSEILQRSWNETHPQQPLQTLNLGSGGRDMRTYLSFGRNMDRLFAPDLVFVLLNPQDFLPLIANADLLAKYQADPTLKIDRPERLNPIQQLISDSPFRQFFIRLQGQTEGFLSHEKTNQQIVVNEQPRGRTDILLGREESVAAQLQALKGIWGERLVIVYSTVFPFYGKGASTSNERETLLREAEKQSIPVINLDRPLLDAYLAKQPPRGFHNSTLGTGHFNRTGHAIAARELLDYLEAAGYEELNR